MVISTSGSKRGGARGLAPPIPPTEDYVLLEDVPQVPMPSGYVIHPERILSRACLTHAVHPMWW